MKSGSIMFWFIPCRMKVPGMYGFQMSGAGMLTFEGMTRMSLRATVPPESAGAAAAGAAVACAAGGGGGAGGGAAGGGRGGCGWRLPRAWGRDGGRLPAAGRQQHDQKQCPEP